jgi:N-methylhydantoinase A
VGVNYRCRIMSLLPKVAYQEIPVRTQGKAQVKRKKVLSYLKDAEGNDIEVKEYERKELLCGDILEGPAIIREAMATTHIVEGQKAIVGKYGEIYIELR